MEDLPQLVVTPDGPINFDPLTADVQLNALVSARILCRFKNVSLQLIFDNSWASFVLNVQNGRVEPTAANAPAPPLSFIPVIEDGSYTIGQSGPPICDQPPLPKSKPVPTPGKTEVGVHLWGSFYAVGPTDGHKDGDVVETTAGKFRFIGAPVGRGWYEKIG